MGRVSLFENEEIKAAFMNMYWCLKLAFRSCLLYHPSNVYEQLIRTRAFDFVSSVSAKNCHFSFVFSDRRLLEDELYYAKKREVGCLH